MHNNSEKMLELTTLTAWRFGLRQTKRPNQCKPQGIINKDEALFV